MGWTLNFQEPENSSLLDELFLAVGKSLYLASSYEAKCHYLLKISRLVDLYNQTSNSSASLMLINAIKEKKLAPAINELAKAAKCENAEIALLVRAKDARNYIAHECSNLGNLANITDSQVAVTLSRLRQEVLVLVEGDNVVSRWIYEMEEKEPAPRIISRIYSKMIESWIFGLTDTDN